MQSHSPNARERERESTGEAKERRFAEKVDHRLTVETTISRVACEIIKKIKLN